VPLKHTIHSGKVSQYVGSHKATYGCLTFSYIRGPQTLLRAILKISSKFSRPKRFVSI